jgi:hypothetical protein
MKMEGTVQAVPSFYLAMICDRYAKGSSLFRRAACEKVPWNSNELEKQLP